MGRVGSDTRTTLFCAATDNEMQTIVVNDPVTWASVGLSVRRTSVLTHSPDPATSTRPLDR